VKLLFDQNISPRILKFLTAELPDCQQVRFAGLEDAADIDIFQYAKKNNYAIVTFDSDFVDLNALLGTPPKIIWINTGNLTTKNVTELILKNTLVIKEYLESDSDEIMELMKAP